MTAAKDHGFFVGYFNNVPAGPRLFAKCTAMVLLLAFAATAFLLGQGVDGTARDQSFAGQEVKLSGIMRTKPYPLLLVAPDAQHAQGRAIMLSGEGKRGPAGLVDGQKLELSGFLLKRGTLDLLVLGETKTASPPPLANLQAVPAGRWRVSGEICDGKCAAGAMHPGTGLAHKACANLCISGGLPPLLAMKLPVMGAYFLLLADADGGPVPARFFDLTALPVELEGDIETIGDVLVLRADWPKARAL